MTRYQYRVLCGDHNAVDYESVERNLNRLGAEGWRVVPTGGDLIIMEREKP